MEKKNNVFTTQSNNKYIYKQPQTEQKDICHISFNVGCVMYFLFVVSLFSAGYIFHVFHYMARKYNA